MQASAREVRLKTTRYFDEQVLRKRPYLLREWCERALVEPLMREVQADGRVRCWVRVRLDGETQDRFLRVVFLEDEETVHNAFFDRDFAEGRS